MQKYRHRLSAGPCKIFRPSWKECVGRSLKNLVHYQKTLRPHGVPSCLRSWLSVKKKEKHQYLYRPKKNLSGRALVPTILLTSVALMFFLIETLPPEALH